MAGQNVLAAAIELHEVDRVRRVSDRAREHEADHEDRQQSEEGDRREPQDSLAVERLHLGHARRGTSAHAGTSHGAPQLWLWLWLWLWPNEQESDHDRRRYRGREGRWALRVAGPGTDPEEDGKEP